VTVSNEASTLIGCPEGELTLGTLNAGVALSKAREVAAQQLLKALPGGKEMPERKCRFDGTDTLCHVIESPSVIVLFTMQELRQGGAALAMCQQPLAMRTVHPACSTVLSFDVSAEAGPR
jgi:hypothetical protein